MLYDMKTESFTRRNGDTGYNISAKCAGYTAIGSTKKADGTDRPPIRIKGLEDTQTQSTAQAAVQPSKSVQDVMNDLGIDIDEEDDDELPF